MTPDDLGLAQKLLTGAGLGGAAILGLIYALRVLWANNQTLIAKIGELQEARIKERDEMVKALNESNRLMVALGEAIK